MQIDQTEKSLSREKERGKIPHGLTRRQNGKLGNVVTIATSDAAVGPFPPPNLRASTAGHPMMCSCPR